MIVTISIPRQFITAEILLALENQFYSATATCRRGAEEELPVLTFGKDAPEPMEALTELEELLVSKGIPFDRQSGDVTRFFRPEFDGNTQIDATVECIDGVPVVPVFDIREHLDKDPAEAIAAIKERLDKVCPSVERLDDKWSKVVIPTEPTEVEIDMDRFTGIL